MRKFIALGIAALGILSLAIVGLSILHHDANSNQRLEREIFALRSALESVAQFSEAEHQKQAVTCNQPKNLQNCISAAAGNNLIVIPKGNYELAQGLLIPSQTKMVISSGATLTLSDSASMPLKGGFVLGVLGTPKKPVSDVTIILNGVIDGNKVSHPYEVSGIEGINIQFGTNITVFGSGSVQNNSGDGIDLDSTELSLVAGLRISSNDGAGIHFGTPRPISSSFGNQIIGIESFQNGVLHQRAGVDVSWPNKNAATYAWIDSQSNYINFQTAGAGTKVIGSVSGVEEKSSEFYGSTLQDINGLTDIQRFTNFSYAENLIRRDIRKLLGFEVPDYLAPLGYFH